jgi:DNA-binding PadR family transcriptional regulator
MTPRQSLLEFALLGTLRHKPHSGYDLRKTFTTTGMRFYSDSPGSVYPALKRLEARGLIEAVNPKNLEADPRKRQLFSLAEKGREALVAWLERHVTVDDVANRLSELMLRFAMMDGSVPRTTTIRFLSEFEGQMAIHAADSRAKLEEMRSKAGLHTGVLAYEAGIEGMERQVSWAQRTRKRLEEGSPK